MSWTAILNQFKRPYLEEQVRAMQSQTIPPEEIIVYSNGKFVDIPDWIHRDCTVIESNKNFGVWARFTIALNATTEYICIFDDDTIPQKKWIENCIEENTKQR